MAVHSIQLNKYVLSCRLNDNTESAYLIFDGRLFHALELAGANARLANNVAVRGIIRSPAEACRFELMLAMGVHSSDNYSGDSPCSILYVRM